MSSSLRSHAPDPSQVTAWVQAERCRASLIALAAEIAPIGVQLLVLKGMYISFGLANGHLLRPMCDADALVVSGSLGRAVRTLCNGKRFAVVVDNISTQMMIDRSNGAFIDLHRWPLPPRFGCMSAAALRLNARPASAAFGPQYYYRIRGRRSRRRRELREGQPRRDWTQATGIRPRSFRSTPVCDPTCSPRE